MAAPGRATDQTGISDPSIVRFRALVEAGLAALEARREEVNDLNVFPVADGDTGDNMVLTLRAVLTELDRLAGASEGRTIDEIGRDEIVASVARAALLGARGNSGVILSQLIRGAAEELISRPGELVDPVLIGAALARAADQAYGSVRDPAEGTILTVVREMAHRVASEIAHIPDARLGADASAGEQDMAIASVIASALEAGQESVKRGPDLLPVLREAGVVDAGGYGLTVLLAGIVGALRGSEAPPLEHHRAARVTHPQHASSTFRYCTNFAVTGAGLEQRRHIDELETLGDSVLVVGDQTTLKIHVHTDDPDAATALFADVGVVSHLDIADMREQIRAPRRAPGGARHRVGVRRAGRRQRRGDGSALRRLRVPGARRRADAQPVHLRPACRHPRRPLRGGGGPAQQRQRGDGGRTRRRAVGEGGARGRLALATGRPGRRREP